jgi:hypothetical protein
MPIPSGPKVAIAVALALIVMLALLTGLCFSQNNEATEGERPDSPTGSVPRK